MVFVPIELRNHEFLIGMHGLTANPTFSTFNSHEKDG